MSSFLSSAMIAALAFLVPWTSASPIDFSHGMLDTRATAPAINGSLPNITIYATGGTIASSGTTTTQTTYYSVDVGIQTLLDAVPQILNISNIKGNQICNVDSGSITSQILLNLTHVINKDLASPESQGAVITHGTDTLEETAFFLDLTIRSEKPVIVTGAMRPSTSLSADGPLNLYQAVTLAGSNSSLGRGTMIALNDRIGSAYFTTKNNANSLDTFYATEQGQLGFFINQVPKFYNPPTTPNGKPLFDLTNTTSLPQVDILYGYQDSNSDLIRASAKSGAKGIVFAGVGAGGWSVEGANVAAQVFNATGIPMVFSHRTVDGYAEGDAPSPAQIDSGFLNPQKSRIMLQLALNAGYDLQAITALFAKN